MSIVDALPNNLGVSRLPVSIIGCKFVREADTGATATSNIFQHVEVNVMISNRFLAYDGYRMKPVEELPCTISTTDAKVLSTVKIVEHTKQ